MFDNQPKFKKVIYVENQIQSKTARQSFRPTVPNLPPPPDLKEEVQEAEVPKKKEKAQLFSISGM